MLFYNMNTEVNHKTKMKSQNYLYGRQISRGMDIFANLTSSDGNYNKYNDLYLVIY